MLYYRTSSFKDEKENRKIVLKKKNAFFLLF